MPLPCIASPPHVHCPCPPRCFTAPYRIAVAALADCQHVNDYFRRAGVATLTVRELFDFVVDPAIAEGAELDAELDRLMELASRWVRAPPSTA